ncbi:hypothetical protein DPMN_129038 [Dreissena polymorpha]|uniref:Uncharacterized protein n=1 Tax=Dreissena polymorpha TaxID=45954 RepID=A0A9D4H0I0_DREPO|nr:hypothetical protein DPMN_129038 [Dreissena polymorpha]
MAIRRVFRREAGWTFAEFAGGRRNGHSLSSLGGGGVDIHQVCRRREAGLTFNEFAGRRPGGHSPNSHEGGGMDIHRVRSREAG